MPQLARPHLRWIVAAIALLAILAVRSACAETLRVAEPEVASLRFLRDGRELRILTLEALIACCEAREVAVEDPYYGVRKRFRALPLERVMARGFGADVLGELGEREVLLRARDGYTRTAGGAQLLGGGAFIAFADVEHPEAGFFPIDRRQVDPAPFYLVWQGEGRADTHVWPWPYQLVEIEVVEFATRFPHVVPAGAAADGPEQRGFTIFRRECIACHAINGEGGTVGPELNVPRSIVEYRPAEQLREFIRDPRSFRYTSMPAHTHLADPDLDALLAYFRYMSARKHDPGSAGH